MYSLDTIGKRLKFLREKLKLTQQEVAEGTNIQRGNLSHYEKDKIKPSSDAIISISNFFKVSTDWLLIGENYTSNSNNNDKNVIIKSNEWELYSNISITDEDKKNIEGYLAYIYYKNNEYNSYITATSEYKKLSLVSETKQNYYSTRVPILGKAAAGSPILVDELFDGFVEVANKKRNHENTFAVRAQGDSMIDAGIEDGDLVLIHAQPIVENNEIALVRIDGEVTIKYFSKHDDRIVLKPANPKYEPIECVKNVTVIGKVVDVIKRNEAELAY